MLSVQISVLGGAFMTTYLMMYDKLKETISPELMGTITIALFFITPIVRLIDQGISDEKEQK